MMFLTLSVIYILKQRYSYGIILLLIYRLSVLLCTLISAGRVDTGWFGKTVVFIGAALGIEIFIRKDALKTLYCLYIILLIPLIINFIMCILGKTVSVGGTTYYFIGLRTQFPNTMIPVIALSMMISYINNKSLIDFSVICTTAICIFQLIWEWVGTGLVLIMLMIMAVFFFSRREFMFHAVLLFVMTLILNIGIVVFRIQNIFAFIIVDMMHKDLTITGRTSIWDVVLKKILENIFWGHGELGNGGIVRVHWANRPVPAHNSMLQIIYDGGLISMMFLMLFFLYACYKLQKRRTSKLSCILGIGIFLIGVQMITEVLQYQIYFYLFPILAYNIDKIVQLEYKSKDEIRTLINK